MTANELRQQFIEFFKEKKHTFVPSAPVIPQDDPTLLFTNAGMNQFKDVFLETGSRPYKRAVNSQKCIRVSGKHNDLEEVGHDTYHHTFFEMLGNWSFGDYYKKEAIAWAWELLTEVWKLPKEKLYATVYTTDDEAEGFWRKETDINPEHILRYGEKDNFWEMGSTGPCGPCSEIHIDLGPERCDKQGQEHTCFVNGDCGRYIELWNLVFIQYNRDEKGELHPLPKRHVDTGAGFERLVAVLQNKNSNYETDVFTPLLEEISRITGVDYHQSDEKSAFHVIADHVRMLTFSITDGGLPSNEGRGYVMRRILRRAARYGRKLNVSEPFIYKIVPKLVETMGEAYPELKERQQHVMKVIRAEEEHFNRTLDRGLEIFERIKNDLKENKQIVIPGADVFKLYDTYGFPVDLTRILAEENGLTLDMEGFEQEMDAQRQRGRAASKFEVQTGDGAQWIILNEGADSRFVGYDDLAIETHIIRYLIGDNDIRLILRETPFYAESGGQVGDKGTIAGEGFELHVIDTQKDGDHIIHICKKTDTFQPQTDKVLAEVVSFARRNTAKNHTATHLLHAALRRVLGEHVQQAGSLVEPDRLRFDFTHFEKVSRTEISEIERIVNRKIQENIPLEIAQEKFDQAKKKGAMALFGEKYGDVVRTVAVPGFSLELCGGTHVSATGEIGAFLITTETSIASGVRRIEAITGEKVVEYLQQSRDLRLELSNLLNAREEEITDKINDLLNQKKMLEKQVQKLQSTQLKDDIDRILDQAESINGVQVLIHRSDGLSANQLKELGDTIRDKSRNTAALLLSDEGGKLSLVCVVSDDLIAGKKLHAGNLVRETAKAAGGGGGGRPHLATAGAKDSSKVKEAIEKFRELIKAS
ncbi:MAG TPA: alanine--tRNA ligase [Caldithrix abyssi]|uniref:Alanine--tRNA ligase n=1 Tax=Caldithrix abyssi TaxID=187145 RepID=A0A7V4U2D8_CALAY|nr:alanine--tRNA ligase [Caldithrix abyssi]